MAEAAFFFAFLHYIYHTRPDPITKRISAVPHYEWRDWSYICLPIDLLTFLLTAEEGRGRIHSKRKGDRKFWKESTVGIRSGVGYKTIIK